MAYDIESDASGLRYALTCDAGTTAVKGALVRSDGMVVASASEQLDLIIDGDRKEQDSNQWWQAFCTVAQRMLAEAKQTQNDFTPTAIDGIIFSGQMQDLIMLDADLNPVRNAILYSDGRALKEAEALAAELGNTDFKSIDNSQRPNNKTDSCAEDSSRTGAQRFLDIVGNRLEGSLPLLKLMWMRTHEPEAFSRTHHVLISSKDYLVARLTGTCIGDVAACSTAGAMSIRSHQWSKTLLNASGIDIRLLPALHAPQERIGTVHAAAAAITGLAEGTPVFAGFGDAGATTFAAGVSGAGQYNINLGTSGWIATVSPEPFVNKLGAANLAFGLNDGFVNAVPFLNAGDVHKWATGVFAGMVASGGVDAGTAAKTTLDYDSMHELIVASAPGANGVMCLPYLVGERFPVMNSEVRGAYVGLSPDTTRADMARAALEGVAFSIRQGMESFDESLVEITLIGGGAGESAWCQIMADVLNHPVEAFLNADIMPAVALASLVFGNPDLPSACRKTVSYMPNPQASRVYNQVYRRFLRLYPAINSIG